MSQIHTVIEALPEPVRRPVEQAWATLPAEQRREAEGVLKLLPTSLRPLKDVLGFVLDQYKPLLGSKRSIAVVGPANVGKSTLYNQLIAHKQDQAEVSPVPGTTRQNQQAEGALFAVIDTPGADAVGEVGERERQIAFQAAQQADFLVIVFEATRGIKRSDLELYRALVALGKPFIVVLNKIDLIPKEDRDEVVAAAAQNLGLQPAQVIETVATEGTNVGKVILGIAQFEPQLLAAIADALPEYRAKLAWQRIVPAASSAGVVGLIPLPLIDFIPLIGIQTGLVLSIARVYGYRITAGRAKELIATFGIGLIARTAYAQLAKLGGVPGWILSAAIAASTTVGIGYAAMVWFDKGERPTRQGLQHMVGDVAVYLQNRLLGLGRQKPERETLRERLSQALKDLPQELRPKDGRPAGEQPSPGVERRAP